MNLKRRFRKNEKIAARRIAGESFLIPVCGEPADLENIFVLNPIADFIWQRLDGERTLEAIVAEIVAEFDVTAKQAGADASELAGRLLANRLIDEVA
jgi:hypothetical protein